jgi:hypothetical protein
MRRLLFALLVCPSFLLAQEASFVPPTPAENTATTPAATVPQNNQIVYASEDSVLGKRIAKISANLEKLPQEGGQMWREFDITPFTKGRTFPAGSPAPEQILIDWILRQTGTSLWHNAPFGILTADSNKLYAYHTKEVLLVIADIVDRFVCPQLFSESCTLRIVSTARPDWQNKGHALLKPIPIATQGIQGWILDKPGAQSLLQMLAQRGDFKELIPPQPLIAHGIQHNVVTKKQRSYVRDVQPNATVAGGYAEDRATIDEGIGLSLTPLALLDQQNMAITIKLDIVQIERMFSTTIDLTTATNVRQRLTIESPQMSYFKLDEILRFPKSQVLLLDLGTVPLPNTVEGDSRNVFAEISRGINPARRGNVLIFIECTSGNALPSVSSSPESTPVRTARGIDSPYWQGLR